MADIIKSRLHRTDTSFITGWLSNIKLNNFSQMHSVNPKSNLRRTDSCFICGWSTDINSDNNIIDKPKNYALNQKDTGITGIRVKILE
uniref:Uncharacterized protein n=1 Tax=viral metagenome TaxID=1070528 RepID=A0A6C0H7L6_9ZZZZ